MWMDWRSGESPAFRKCLAAVLGAKPYIQAGVRNRRTPGRRHDSHRGFSSGCPANRINSNDAGRSPVQTTLEGQNANPRRATNTFVFFSTPFRLFTA